MYALLLMLAVFSRPLPEDFNPQPIAEGLRQAATVAGCATPVAAMTMNSEEFVIEVSCRREAGDGKAEDR